MCVSIWRRSRKTRIWIAVANVCLFSGLVAGIVFHPATAPARDWLDGVRGLLIGMSIGMYLMLVWKADRCGGSTPGS